MEDIENYSILGINIGGGKNSPRYSGEDNDGIAFFSGILGGAILGIGMSQIIDAITDVNKNRIQEIVRDIERKADLNEKLRSVRLRIESGNDIDLYGGMLILFSELEKFVNAMYSKYIRSYNKPDTFKEKVSELEKKNIISGIESNILRDNIYPKRNMMSHGDYEKVDRKDIIACYDFISQFINKYYSLLR
jgi:hypothetical protein